MKKILIVGAGVEQMDAVRIAKALGHHVIVSDYNSKAPAIDLADEFFLASTNDSQANLNIAKEQKIDGILTVCSETAVPTVAFVAEQLKLRSFTTQTALLATNKFAMRKALQSHAVPMAKWITTGKIEEARSFAEKVKGPWIVKPVDSSGQRGMSKINDIAKLDAAFVNAQSFSTNDQVLLDQFLQGPEYHVTMWVFKGVIHFLAISDRITLDSPHFGIAVRHIAPSALDKEKESIIKDVCKKAVKGIGHENGVATCEVILYKGVPHLMEIAIRVPGGYLRDVAMHLSGVDIIKATILDSLGEVPHLSELITEEVHKAVSVEFITRQNLTKGLETIDSISTVSNPQAEQDIQLINWHFDFPFTPPKLSTSVGRFGVIITTGDNQKEALTLTDKVFKSLIINNQYTLAPHTNYSTYSFESIKKHLER